MENNKNMIQTLTKKEELIKELKQMLKQGNCDAKFVKFAKWLNSLNGNYKGITRNDENRYYIAKIKKAKKENNSEILTKEMEKVLNSLSFPWEYDKDWFTPFYNWLVSLNGNYARINFDEKFGNTCKNVKSSYSTKKGIKLTDEMIEKLNQINFPWPEEKRDWFTPFYEWLVSLNGNYESLTMNKTFGTTVKNIRNTKNKNDIKLKLTDEMIEKLNAINFPWRAEKKDWFTPFYEWLVSLNGNYKGITLDKTFGSTVVNIRRSKKGQGHYALTDDMIKKLNKINFPWALDWFTPFYSWLVSLNGQYQNLTKDKNFGNTVHNLRQGKFNLTGEQIDKLNSIGFPWTVNKTKRSTNNNNLETAIEI